MHQPISLIISFYNKIEILKFIFAALELQTYHNFEVVIADDGSKTEVAAEINRIKSTYFFQIKHVWQEDNGWQKNKILNKAVVASEGEYLIFIDGDCIPEKHFIQEHVENRAENQVVSGRRVMLTEKTSNKLSVQKVQNGYLNCGVAFPLFFETVFDGKQTYMENMLRIRNKFLRHLFLKDRRRFLLGCNFSVWKSDMLKVNGFDERFVYPGTGEDLDLEERLSRIGVYPVSKKHLVTVFHYDHVHYDCIHEPNQLLNAENNLNQVTFTPYGIKKNTNESTINN
jgi:glycosyltransferase involved in cell wall biosynthesis